MKKGSDSENDFGKGFMEWLESEAGEQSLEAVDYVFEALEGAELDVARRTIQWVDGQELSIDQSVERIHKQTGLNAEPIRSHIIGWLQLGYQPEGLDKEQLQTFESQIDDWIHDYENSIKE
jgi:hypothetical protein